MQKVQNIKNKVPTILTLLGATGDLSKRKILPALFDLHHRGLLEDNFKIIGFARSKFSDEEYHNLVLESLKDKGHEHDSKEIVSFLKRITYQSGDFTDPVSFRNLSEVYMGMESDYGQCANKIFYLSVAPQYYDIVFRSLADSGLAVSCGKMSGWTRIFVEKPFGSDIETAKDLDKTLGLLFDENQIFRVDHYLEKEAIQDILMFRFSNLIFEPIWNNKYIEKIEIKLKEDIGVGARGAFYDGIGALRDVGENHMLQMLAFVAMEKPRDMSADAIRSKRAEVINSLQTVQSKDLKNFIIRGQYNGYTEENNVLKDSQTETYFKFKTFIDNDKWSGVPFIFESGKFLDEKNTEIKVYFKSTESCLCSTDNPRNSCNPENHKNILTFKIQPEEGISILFWINNSGFTRGLQQKELSFLYDDFDTQTEGKKAINKVSAYEKILLDGISGDATAFASTEEVLASWKFITPILENWDNLELHKYEKGSYGPDSDVIS